MATRDCANRMVFSGDVCVVVATVTVDFVYKSGLELCSSSCVLGFVCD